MAIIGNIPYFQTNPYWDVTSPLWVHPLPMPIISFFIKHCWGPYLSYQCRTIACRPESGPFEYCKRPYDPRWSSCFTLTVADVAGFQPENGTCWRILSIKQVQTECSDRNKIHTPNIYQPFTKFQRSNFPLASKTPRSSTSQPSQPQVLHVEGSVRAAGLQKRLFPWPRRSTEICYIICIYMILMMLYDMLFYHVVMKWL